MARRQHATLNGNHFTGDAPPPSTLAAQIVQNQTRQATSQPQEENASFRDLLHEILHSNAAAPETDVNVNAQLINVVLQAGLVPLTLDNPFADWDILIPQAMDSIAVIESTIRRQPQVLMAQLAPDGPQLILSILATLIALCGKAKCEQLAVRGLIVTSLNSLERSHELWRNARGLLEVLQHCVDEVLSVLEALPMHAATLNISLPPARGLAQFWPQSEGSIALPQGSTTIVTETSRAFSIALELCQIPGLDVFWKSEACLRLQQLALKVKPQLSKATSWDHAFDQLLRLPHHGLLVSTLLGDVARSLPSTATQRALASNLMSLLDTQNHPTRDAILPSLRVAASEEAWSGLHEDLRIAITAWLSRFDADHTLPELVDSLRETLNADDAMTDSELQTRFQRLSLAAPCSGRRPRLRKRRKISTSESGARQRTVYRRISRLLAGADTEDLSVLPDVAVSVFNKLQQEDRRTTWQCLVDLAEYDVSTTLLLLSRLLGAGEPRQDGQQRVLALNAIRLCLERTTDVAYIDIQMSIIAQHVLNSLRSSIRELRTAAAKSLSALLRDSLPEGVRIRNRQVVLEHLRNASTRDVASEQEILVSAWGQVAISCGDKELNLALLQLVEYLGYGNTFVCAMAFSELEAIAAHKDVSPKDLFQPFWRSVAVAVVQELHSRPQKAQQLCDLLSMDINIFLKLTQRETLPFLVLTKRKDVLQRIANARGNGTTVEDVCMQPRTNLAAILAFLLSQSSHEAEDLAFSCLTDVAPDLSKTDLSSLVKVDPVLVACEMLKLSGEQSPDRKSRAYQAFQSFANIAERAPGQRKAHAKSSRAVSTFLDDKVLGILTLFSTMLESGPRSESTMEKLRCLKGMTDMFIIAKGKLSFALPQIRGCLQSGLDQPELCEVAFQAWLSLIPLLEEDDVAIIVDETFVLITRHWAELTLETQQRTHEMLQQLIKTHNTLLQENIMTLPSLGGIPLLSKIAAEFDRLRSEEMPETFCKAFASRLRDDGDTVVLQAVRELVPFLDAHQGFIHDTAASEQPSQALSDLLCALLDITVKYSSTNPEAAELCGKALGIIGCLDSNRVEATRRKGHILVLSNFDTASEVIDWVIALLEDVLVKSFKSVTNAKSQGFLAYTMQELLGFCNFTQIAALRPRASQASEAATKWYEMPEHVRTALTPLLTSRYVVTSNSAVNPPNRKYPGFTPDDSHSSWLRSITYDLMFKGKGDNAKAIFTLLARIIRGQDMAISRFLFPYAVLNVVIGGSAPEVDDLTKEFMAVLQSHPETSTQQENIRLCSESVFTVLDYMSTWLREKRQELSVTRTEAYKTGISPNEFDEARDEGQIQTVETFLASIPAEIIATQAISCRSYARALFHWEQYIRQKRELIPSGKLTLEHEDMYNRLQDIYTQIDEPDGLEGIAAHLPLITEEQQTINHAKAGRWTAAQAWYELQLGEQPSDAGLQREILQCQKETGQYATLLRYANSFLDSGESNENQTVVKALLPLAAEACWMTEDFNGLKRKLLIRPEELQTDFNLCIGQVLASTSETSKDMLSDQIRSLRISITEGLSMASTDSLQTCHSELMKLHVLYEIEALSNVEPADASRMVRAFDKRLNAVGAYLQDKQYILGTRRAVMQLHPTVFKNSHRSASWLTTARLARQSKHMKSAYNAVLKAYECSDREAKVEEARLLWTEGHQRQAIQALEATIASGVLEGDDPSSSLPVNVSAVSSGLSDINGFKQTPIVGKALLLLAKWLDASGQSQTKDMIDRYQLAARRHQRWEKGHYYLGKHYSKLLDVQKDQPREKQIVSYSTGELTKLVIDNSLRSVPFGNKYWHETIPRVITLWLQLGMDCLKQARGEDDLTFEKRKKSLQACNRQLQKYFERVPPYVFYHALPQLISRITHPHPEVWKQLCNILVRIVSAHPSQSLWSLLPVPKATDRMRQERGKEVLLKLRDPKSQTKGDGSNIDLKSLIIHSQRLSDGLLLACEQPVEARAVNVSLSKNLAFKLSLAPSNLVVPVESTLTATAPAAPNSETIRRHKAFAQDKITIQSFQDDVLVLNSLQRPRKITVRGSDGKLYGLLCKPKDDLRKDQRLMEFNGIINRALKRNTQSSKRRLFIKTYAVTPLSEESGSIEWVEGIKPLRDILLNTYQRRGVRPNYNQIKKDLDVASAAEENAHVFKEEVLSQFEPVLHEWFTETYPEPEIWFNARLRYARSAAVMSIVGHVLGLGDRHGENILLMEGTGGVFHVDFNCLFDKGLTFEKPELVPFRLTHNMVDAMGPYGYEGPFRKSSELTLSLLRQERDTLMTVLETFLYDPTADFIGKKKRKTHGVPDTPAEVLESVSQKLKGLILDETVPLSVEGYVHALIAQATSHFRLASMYIGWCSFL
ncbi:Putative phosphatidylinositol 3-/4-kinase, catalytic domain, FATC domain, UME [Septoria linicola]|uniref:non-specific serine/threonine protein kinase n=1 Tax=Septoria linicola TaxID=215465 RepID=A0A9Q9AYP6_9PEZI|nr:Putative phosphatidylinositol 3-/4-kinase, catalytic domain, FATC domain, UME [Septoria linicola]